MQSHKITGLLAITIFLSGAAFAAITPFRAIVGVEYLGLTNAEFGLVMALNAAGAAFSSVSLGWLSDRMIDRRLPILLCAAVGCIAFGLIWMLRTPVVFISTFCLLVPFGNALFSQSFAYSRAYFENERPDHAELIISWLRSIFSVAWIIVPPVAGWIATQSSVYSAFAFASVAYLGCTLSTSILMLQSGAVIRPTIAPTENATSQLPPKITISSAHTYGILGVTLSLAALQLNMVLLPLVIVRDLGGTVAEVGITSAIAAAIEVPVMIGWGYVSLRLKKDFILAIASAIFAFYFGVMLLAQSTIHVIILQGISAVSIAALLSINISYLQEAIPGRIGLSTSLIDVTRVISVFIASTIFAVNPGTTYAPLMAFATLLCLCGCILFLCAAKKRQHLEAC